MPPAARSYAEVFDAREQTRIVAAARALYLSQGLAAVSLTDLARYLRMPEHAVQRWFPSTEPLLMAVLDAHVANVQAELGSYQERYTTAVEELLALRNWASAELQRNSSPFFRELEVQYPEAYQRWYGQLLRFPREHLRTNLLRGMQQGLYRPSLDVEQEVATWFEQLGTLHRANQGTSAAELHHAQLNDFLARLVTPAGALVARRLQEAAPYY